jgi:hypothetical protein
MQVKSRAPRTLFLLHTFSFVLAAFAVAVMCIGAVDNSEEWVHDNFRFLSILSYTGWAMGFIAYLRVGSTLLSELGVKNRGGFVGMLSSLRDHVSPTFATRYAFTLGVHASVFAMSFLFSWWMGLSYTYDAWFKHTVVSLVVTLGITVVVSGQLRGFLAELSARVTPARVSRVTTAMT